MGEPLMPPLSTTSTRERLTLTLMPTWAARLPLDFLTPTLLPPDMPTTPDTSPTPLIPPTLSTTPMLPMPPMWDTLDTPDTPDSMPSARGMLTLMPTPSARLLLDFLTPTLLPPDMPTTPDTLPTPLSPPDLSTTPMLPSPPTDMASTVSTTVKHAAIRIPYNTKPNRIFQFKDVFQFINKCQNETVKKK